MGIFLRIYETILTDPISFGFSVAIIAWFSVAVLSLFAGASVGKPVGARLILITPNGLSTIGVLGTFTGILVGLLDFDVAQIDDSVPLLLGGLKIAFTTSIVGIASSITFRFIKALTPTNEGTEDVSGEQIYQVLRTIRDDGQAASLKSEELMNSLRSAISSDGDSSLLTQVQKLRSTVQDSQADLIKEFRDFAKHMVENNQKAIVEALEQVIRDFNENLTEQFGENFKELNSAVYALVEWQDRYKEHIEQLEGRIQEAVSATASSAVSLATVEEHAAKIPDSIAALGPVLTGLLGQTEILESQLEAVANLRTKAVGAFPVIESNIVSLTTGFATSVDEAVSRANKALSDSEAQQSKLGEGYELLRKEAATAQSDFSTAISETMKQMSDQASKSFEHNSQLIETGSREANKAIADVWAENGQKVNAQFADFDAQMQDELKRCLELLGRQLASVSEKLVSDYSHLMRNLQSSIDKNGPV